MTPRTLQPALGHFAGHRVEGGKVNQQQGEDAWRGCKLTQWKTVQSEYVSMLYPSTSGSPVKMIVWGRGSISTLFGSAQQASDVHEQEKKWSNCMQLHALNRLGHQVTLSVAQKICDVHGLMPRTKFNYIKDVHLMTL